MQGKLSSDVPEYEKRLSRFCQLQVTELEPVSLPQNPSEKEIAAALEKRALNC
ncbi:MAG: hypothetical protein ACLR5S_08775 [Ruminococcus sp.]